MDFAGAAYRNGRQLRLFPSLVRRSECGIEVIFRLMCAIADRQNFSATAILLK